MFLLWTAAVAQPQEPALNLDECVRLALASPSTVSIARRDREIADKDRVRVRSGFLPQASVNLGHVYNSPSLVNPDSFSFIPLNGVREFVALTTIIQELDVSGRLRADYARARAAQEGASASLAIAERDLRRAVATAYYRLLLARHLVDVIGASAAESESFERRVRLLADQGEAARADVVKAAAQTAGLRQSLGGAELAAELANQDLAAFWTRDVDRRLNIVDVFSEPLPPPEPPVNVATPYLRRPEFRFLDAQQTGFRAEARREKAGLFPRLTLGYQYGLDATRVAWNNRGYATFVNLNVPLFDWFRSLSLARQFQARASQVADSRSIAERTLSRDYQNALARVKLLYTQLSQSREQVALAEEDFKLSRVRYEGGEGAALDVVVAQNQLAQARSNYYALMASYLNGRIDLEVAAGR